MKKVLTALLSLVMVMAITACGTTTNTAEGSTDASGKFPMTLTDKFDNELVIEKAPETIISMSPEMTEIIYALGAGDQLIGRSSYCNYPEEVAEVADFGTLLDINVENVVAAQPDMIIVSSMAGEDIVQTLKDQELTVVAIDKDKSLIGTYDYIETIAQILDKEAEAATLIEEIKTRISDVEAAVKDLDAPSAYYIVYAGDGYDSTATGDTFINDMISIAGGDNVAKDGLDWSYSVEALVEHDPSIMFCDNSEGTKVRIQDLEGYKDLTAIKEDHLYEVNADIFSRQGPRIGEAIQVLAELMHPGAFE